MRALIFCDTGKTDPNKNTLPNRGFPLQDDRTVLMVGIISENLKGLFIT